MCKKPWENGGPTGNAGRALQSKHFRALGRAYFLAFGSGRGG